MEEWYSIRMGEFPVEFQLESIYWTNSTDCDLQRMLAVGCENEACRIRAHT